MAKNAAGVEVFNGFIVKYPEYSVITPQTLKEFTIRTLTVNEEETLKSSMLTPNKLAEHLNQIIFSCICKKPEEIKDYDAFLNSVSIKDRDALMFGLYHVTYKDINAYDVTCENCEKVNSVKVNFEKSFTSNFWENKEDDILKKEIPVKLDIAQGITAIIVQPKLIDEQKILNETAFASESVRDMNLDLLSIKRFEIDKKESKTPDTIEDRSNILKGYKQLPSVDRKKIDNEYFEKFGKYNVSVKTIVNCQKCGFENRVTIDLVKQFFRSIYQ